MTARRSGPGPQLSSGRLRVDAGRAIKKLREYQLADRSAWILEAVRAAVASNATAIRVDGDANDIWLAWDGPAWEVDVLPRLFDELVSPASSEDVQHVRLLAAAVNSALGMNPAYVDVYTVTSGKAHVARYTPDVLEEPSDDLGESRLAHVEAAQTEAPERVANGMALHLRRRISLQVLGYFVGEPPELKLVEESCRDIAVPLTIKGKVLHRDTTRDIVRMPLGEGTEGFVAVNRSVAGPTLQVAEHGVLLATYEFELERAPLESVPVPLRVFVDAPRMPTNASRSQVRRDKHPISSAEARARKLIDDVLGKLAATPGDAARAAALEWIAAYAGGPRWHEAVSGMKALREIIKLPLVKNAVGESRSLNNHWRSEIYTGSKPLPVELATWLSDMLWLPPGDAARCLLQGAPIDGRAARRTIRWAKREADAQRKFFAHAKRHARVETARKPRVRGTLGADVPTSTVGQDRFEGMTGEICVYTEGSGGSLVVLLEGRELERITVKSPIAFDVVVDSSRVKPDDRYRGVKRDAEFARVERAVMGGIVRALEAVAAMRAGAESVDGYELVDDPGRTADAALFRRVLAMLDELGLKVRGPLNVAPAWESLDGKWIATSDLRKAPIGVVEPGASVTVPAQRLVIYASEDERGLLGKLAGNRIIRYDRIAGERAYGGPRVVAERLAKGRPGALGIQADGLIGAIAPSSKASFQMQHVGIGVETKPYVSKHISCAILVDSDAIVPDTDWRSVIDDAGLLERNYVPWELALIRALARALCGEWDPLLVGRTFGLRDPLGLALCESLVDGEPEKLLDAELLTALKQAPLLDVLGRRDKISINELVALFPTDVPVLSVDAGPVAGFTPLVAPQVVAQAVGKLAGVKIFDASGELQRRIKRAQYEKRYADHCAEPVGEITIDAPERVEVLGQEVRGVVGVGNDIARGIRVFVEQRKFAELPAPDGLPLMAAVELAPDQCGELFEGIPANVAKRIAKDVRKAAPALLVEIGKDRPALLTQAGPTRRLLVALLGDLSDVQRHALCRVPAFRTIADEPISLEAAASPNRAIRYAAWTEGWLPPGDGESVTALDAPILRIGDDEELTKICDELADLPLIDVGDEVERLQAHRRMARGLLPTPRVPGGLPELKRALVDLGDAGKRLGHGELALVDSEQSTVRLHDRGRFMRALPIDVMPSVVLAIEDHDIKPADRAGKLEMFLEAHPLTRATQHLTRTLLEQVLPGASLTPRMRNNLAHAALMKRIDPKLLGDLPVLETIDGRWLPWSTIESQVSLFGDVWAVAEKTANRPLDERRIVLVIPGFDMARTQGPGFTLVPAAKELEMDELARKNRARQPVLSLAMPTKHGVLVEMELDGDGKTSPRGTVAILTPSITGNRGVWVHREMQPLGVATDPCPWPTIAMIDDARIIPDRTWSGPKQDQTWQAIVKTIKQASESLIERLGEAPADAIATLRIDFIAEGSKELRKHNKAQLRGIVWLAGFPYDHRYRLQLTHGLGVMTHMPEHGEPMGGQLLLFSNDKLDRTVMLNEVVTIAHGDLVRQIMGKRETLPRELVSAHVALALALETIKPTEVRGVEFTCFAPHPIEARALVSLLRKNRVDVVKPGDSPTVTALVDDGTPTSLTLLRYLGKRVRRIEPPPEIVVPPPPPPRIVPAAPKPAPPPAPEPQHPLRPLVQTFEERLSELGLHGYPWKIVARRDPIIGFADGHLTIAGDNPRLRVLAGDLDSSAIELLVAHVVTVLNIALTAITDATEAHALGLLLASRRTTTCALHD